MSFLNFTFFKRIKQTVCRHAVLSSPVVPNEERRNYGLLAENSNSGELHYMGDIPFYLEDKTLDWVWDGQQAGDFVRLPSPRYHVLCEYRKIPKAVLLSVLPHLCATFTLPKSKFSAMDVIRMAHKKNYSAGSIFMSQGDLRNLAVVVDNMELKSYLVTTKEIPYFTVDTSKWPVSCVVNKAYMFFDVDRVYPEMCWDQKGLPLYKPQEQDYPTIELGGQCLFRVHELMNGLAIRRHK